jgi:hypothetical protein
MDQLLSSAKVIQYDFNTPRHLAIDAFDHAMKQMYGNSIQRQILVQPFLCYYINNVIVQVELDKEPILKDLEEVFRNNFKDQAKLHVLIVLNTEKTATRESTCHNSAGWVANVPEFENRMAEFEKVMVPLAFAIEQDKMPNYPPNTLVTIRLCFD